jgi:hypothetical protein
MVPSLKANTRKHLLPGLPVFLFEEDGGTAMIIHHADRLLVKWAIDSGYPYEYIREYGLPEPVLRVRLGLSTAFFEAGTLVHWRADVDATHMDQLMYELTSLFGLCAQAKAYPAQKVFLASEPVCVLQTSRAV